MLSLLCFALLVFSGFAHAHHYATLQLRHKVYRGGSSFTDIQEGAVYSYMMPNGYWGCTSPGSVFSSGVSRTTFKYTGVYGTAYLSYMDFLNQTWGTTAAIQNTGNYADVNTVHYADKAYHGVNVINVNTLGTVSTSLYELRVGRSGLGTNLNALALFDMTRNPALNSQTRDGTNYSAVPVVLGGAEGEWSIYILYKNTNIIYEFPYMSYSDIDLVGDSVYNFDIPYIPELNDRALIEQLKMQRAAGAPVKKNSVKLKKLSEMKVELTDKAEAAIEGEGATETESETVTEEKIKEASKERTRGERNEKKQQNKRTDRPTRERKNRR